MAIKSVDDLDRIWSDGHVHDAGESWVRINEMPAKTKAALQAYIARECARKMLEIIGEDEPEEVVIVNTVHPVNISKWRNQLRAELRAAIQEMEGK